MTGISSTSALVLASGCCQRCSSRPSLCGTSEKRRGAAGPCAATTRRRRSTTIRRATGSHWGGGFGLGRGGRTKVGFGVEGEGEAEGRAGAELAGDCEVAVVGLGDLAGDVEAEAHAADVAVGDGALEA